MAATDLWRRENQRSISLYLVVVAAALLIARMISSMSQPTVKASELVAWVPIADAGRTAAASHKRIFYDFTADWCIPCQNMEEQVYRDPAFAKKLNDRFVPVRVLDRIAEDGINSAEVEALKRRYQVRAFPTIVVTNAQGGVVRRSEGFVGRRPFEQMVDSLR